MAAVFEGSLLALAIALGWLLGIEPLKTFHLDVNDALLALALHTITPAYALLAALIGLYLGGIWMATDNLLVPITIHAVYDFLVLLYLIKTRPGPKSG